VQRYKQIYEYVRQQPMGRNSLAELAKAHMSGGIKKKPFKRVSPIIQPDSEKNGFKVDLWRLLSD
jgi:hypothetical protein